MQDLIKRYFWVLGAVVVMACATFAAVAASFAFEATVLSDPDHGPKIVPATGGPAPVITKAGRNKDGGQLASRDMFCSECLPKIDVAAKPGDNNIVNTSLPLQLLATNVTTDPKDSFATIINMENQIQGSFSVGDKVPGATGAIKEIHYKYIDFENNNRTERLVLQGAPPPEMPKQVAEATPAVGSGSGDGDLELIKKIDDNNYEIDKSLVAKVLENPMSVAKGARVVPAIKNGKPDGFKLYAIKPGSLIDRLGFKNGDTLRAINGFALTSADKALEAYAKVRDATEIQVTVGRAGQNVTLTYRIH
jgi:general secretion pathway protein C